MAINEQETAENIVKTVLLLNKLLKDAHRSGLKLEIENHDPFDGRAPYLTARVYRETTLAKSPTPQEMN